MPTVLSIPAAAHRSTFAADPGLHILNAYFTFSPAFSSSSRHVFEANPIGQQYKPFDDVFNVFLFQAFAEVII